MAEPAYVPVLTQESSPLVSPHRIGKEALDPAILDRRTTHLPGLDETGLPIRTMSIAGLEGKLSARILSKDMSGPATRVVRFEGGWGTGAAGVFTADVSLLVLKGHVRIGGETLGRHDFARMPRRGLVPGIRAEDGTLALLLTGAPVAYDTTSGGIASAVEIVREGDIPWERQPRQSRRLIKPLDATGSGEFWLGASVEWSSGDDDPWHRHPVAEEVFVLEGAITISELGADGPESYMYKPGGYVWRPAGILHCGPGSAAAETAITFHHTSGDLETEWVDERGVIVPPTGETATSPGSILEG